MTEDLMVTLTPQLRQIATKRRASHALSIQDRDIEFQKLIDKIEQAEKTMKIEKTENLKLQNVGNIQTRTSQIIDSLKYFYITNHIPSITLTIFCKG